MSDGKKKRNIFKRMIAWFARDNEIKKAQLSRDPMRQFEIDQEVQRTHHRHIFRF